MQKRQQKPSERKSTLRTRGHQIDDLSVHHVEGFILRAGHTAEIYQRDYGYDLVMFTFSYNKETGEGEFEPEHITMQLKATDNLTVLNDGKTVSFAGIERHHWKLWNAVLLPFFLIVYDAKEDVAYWLDVHAYEEEGKAQFDAEQASVSVHIPKSNVVDEQAIEIFRQRKQQRYNELKQRRR